MFTIRTMIILTCKSINKIFMYFCKVEPGEGAFKKTIKMHVIY